MFLRKVWKRFRIRDNVEFGKNCQISNSTKGSQTQKEVVGWKVTHFCSNEHKLDSMTDGGGEIGKYPDFLTSLTNVHLEIGEIRITRPLQTGFKIDVRTD